MRSICSLSPFLQVPIYEFCHTSFQANFLFYGNSPIQYIEAHHVHPIRGNQSWLKKKEPIMQDYKKLKNNLALKKIDLGKLKYKISDIINK